MDVVVTYDLEKSAENDRIRGFDFEIAKTALFDNYALTTEDFREYDEQRNFTIGMSSEGLLLIVLWTPREPNEMRIISARQANKHQQRSYNNAHRRF